MALYGDNLAKTIGPGTTCQQATDVLSTLQNAILSCYSSLTLYNNWKANGTLDTINLAILSAISPDDAASMKDTLDTELAHLYAVDTLVNDAGNSAGMDSPLPSVAPNDLLDTVAGSVQTASSAIALNDSLFHTSVAAQVSDAVVPVVGDFADKIANVVSKFLGNFLGGIWWILALGILSIWAWHKWGKK